MSEPPEGLLEVGRISRPHGLGGDVYVDLSTDRTERLDPGSRLWCRGEWLTVTACRPPAAALAACASRDSPIAPPPSGSPTAACTPNRSTTRTPSGCTTSSAPQVVELDGTERGRCVAVIDNPAADLLELDSGALVPVTFVVGFDDGVVTIDPPEGPVRLMLAE